LHFIVIALVSGAAATLWGLSSWHGQTPKDPAPVKFTPSPIAQASAASSRPFNTQHQEALALAPAVPKAEPTLKDTEEWLTQNLGGVVEVSCEKVSIEDEGTLTWYAGSWNPRDVAFFDTSELQNYFVRIQCISGSCIKEEFCELKNVWRMGADAKALAYQTCGSRQGTDAQKWESSLERSFAFTPPNLPEGVRLSIQALVHHQKLCGGPRKRTF